MQDRDIDNLANPHEVKHWMDPKLIPYGWGLFEGLDGNEDLGKYQSMILKIEFVKVWLIFQMKKGWNFSKILPKLW